MDTYSLTKLLWEMHAECIVVFPEGVEYLPWMIAGSINKIIGMVFNNICSLLRMYVSSDTGR